MQSENLLEPANYSSHKIKWGAWGASDKTQMIVSELITTVYA